MARKKAPPKRAPEYEKPKPKKKSPPGKAKDGSKCFSRTNKGGAAYVTCEGSQMKAKARASLKKGGPAPVMTKKKVPAGSHRMPDGSIMKNKDMPKKQAPAKAKAPAEKPKLTAAQIRAKEYRENFRYDVGDKVYFRTGINEKAKVIAGTIEALTDKGVVMRANKGEVEKSVNRGFNFSVSYTWRPTEGTQKKVVSWGRVRGVQEYTGKSVSLGRVGG